MMVFWWESISEDLRRRPEIVLWLLNWNLAQIMPKLTSFNTLKKKIVPNYINYSFRLQLTHFQTDREELRNPHKLMTSQCKRNKFYVTKVSLLLFSKSINYYCVKKNTHITCVIDTSYYHIKLHSILKTS